MSALQTALVDIPIQDLDDAADWCGRLLIQQGQRKVPLTLTPAETSCNFYVAVPEGFWALIHSFGQFVARWEAGFHYCKPWINVYKLVTQQYITYDTPVKQCPTLDNVMVEIDVSVVFYIKQDLEDVKRFCYEIGPPKLDDMLAAYQQQTVRVMARNKKYSNIYDLMDTEELELPEVKEDTAPHGNMKAEKPIGMDKDDLQMTPLKKIDPRDLNKDGVVDISEQLANIKKKMNEEFQDAGIAIYSITITNVVLPADFRNQMESATTFESKNRCAEAEQEYNLLVIKDQEKRAQAEQRLGEELAEMKAKNQQRLAGEAKLTANYAAGTEAIMADIREKMNSDLRAIRTASELAVAKMEKQRDLELAQIDAETDAEVLRINTEVDAYIMSERAKTKQAVAAMEAETTRLLAEAEKVAATRLIAKRDFEAKMAQLRILRNLACNSQVSVSGTNKDNVVAQIVASQNAAVALGLNP